MTPSLTFLIDVDNTLIDNDAVGEDLRRHLLDTVGDEGARRYWEIVEQLWAEVGYADYLGAAQRHRIERPRDQRMFAVSSFLLQYPFADRVYPRALDAIRHLSARGPVVLLTDGDAVYQPNKVERSGLRAAVDGRVLVYIHKEQMLDDIERRYPAQRYVMVDDKMRILAAMKAIWGGRLTTVFVRQGRFALDPAQVDPYPPADITIDRVGDLINVSLG